MESNDTSLRIRTDRRRLLKSGMLGLAGIATPALARAYGFTHAVASGEPGPNQVLLWTRYSSDRDVTLRWEVSTDMEFTRIAAGGECLASPAADCCTKTVARGLEPATWYFYRFIAPSGEISAVGRTRTLPQGAVASFRMAVFSCSNYGFGWFNAYAHAAADDSFDLAVHLGDYLYEYPRGTYPSERQVVAGRVAPLGEMIALADYRERYALYRSDHDLQRLHQLYPMITVWDDHESANDSWRDGAENHQAEEGDWAVRKAAARQAYREWMPVSDDDYASYDIGDLATLFRLETRLTGRDRPFDIDMLIKDAGPDGGEAALAAFRDGAWRDPSRQLLGAGQEAWLAAGFKTSTQARKPWQVLIQQVIMGRLDAPANLAEGVAANASQSVRTWLATSRMATAARLPWNMDAWDGYPAARDRLYAAALEADANLVVLTGDTHNAWALDLDRDGARVGVEMAGTSVTSPGTEGYIAWRPSNALARDLVGASPQLKWCDMSQRGYLAVELTPGAATGEFRFVSTVRQRSAALGGTHRMTVLAGQRKYSA